MLQPLKTSPKLPGPHPQPPTAHPQTLNRHLKAPIFINTPRISPQTAPPPIILSPSKGQTLPCLLSLRNNVPRGPLPLRSPPNPLIDHSPQISSQITPHLPHSLSQTPLPSASSQISPHKLPHSSQTLAHRPSLTDPPPQPPHIPPAAPLLDLAELLALAERLEGEALVALGTSVERRHPAAPLTDAARPPGPRGTAPSRRPLVARRIIHASDAFYW